MLTGTALGSVRNAHESEAASAWPDAAGVAPDVGDGGGEDVDGVGLDPAGTEGGRDNTQDVVDADRASGGDGDAEDLGVGGGLALAVGLGADRALGEGDDLDGAGDEGAADGRDLEEAVAVRVDPVDRHRDGGRTGDADAVGGGPADGGGAGLGVDDRVGMGLDHDLAVAEVKGDPDPDAEVDDPDRSTPTPAMMATVMVATSLTDTVAAPARA